MKCINLNFFLFFFASTPLTLLGVKFYCLRGNLQSPCVVELTPYETAFQKVVFKLLNSVEQIFFNSYIRFSKRHPRYLFPLNTILKYSIQQVHVKNLCQRLNYRYVTPTYIQFYTNSDMIKDLFSSPLKRTLSNRFG
ncbi:Hypothetical protein SRAE_X000225500 [Strongyloides ratti]|uniref:Uncharacterized protein n=1 Tax=Strongyloides ratti TaxID=34506 RepID=A0A090KXB0_STRRB|nr:Hypothetical protein SRAE_X000225500 [Strongyloides ratti]CEF60517.1 Hypothetical protein SRAE_X000225500 [Strongyloides ratti]